MKERKATKEKRISFPFPSVVSANGWLLQFHSQYEQQSEINLYGKLVVSFNVDRMDVLLFFTKV